MLLTPKHIEFQDRVREFAQKEVAPLSAHLDKTGEFSLTLFKKLGESGLLGIPFPKEYGGAGLDTLSYAIAVEEISRVCGSTGIFVAAHISLGCSPIWIAGNEEQKQKWLIPLARGEKTGSFGLTEPNAGSDAAGTETTVKKVGNKYIINGAKRFITSGAIGEVITFTATHDKSKGSHGISAFVVEKGTPGYSAGKDEDKLGLRGSITSELIFEDCAIPCENLLGCEGEGFKVFMKTLDGGRISIGALALGIAQGALDAAIEFAKNSGQHKEQSIQGLIADMATRVAAARGLIYQASMLKDAGSPYTKEAAMAKFYAAEIGMWVCTQAVEICGIAGVTKKYNVERFIRDVKLTEIGEGTSEIQKIVIAREILGK
ncbi:MAG: acyl-CoA dehydrogenase family protein [Candidatus Stahlbacteria bacterium]|nr:acyl-CoA dehydrogenase family protein [Candidatus Stahlbacteria bacterium]